MRSLLAGVAAACTGVDLSPPPANPNLDCTGSEVYVAGISRETAGGVTVSVVDAAPAPPDVGDNTWVLELRDAAGAPVSGPDVQVTPWMPLHGHGLSPSSYAANESAPGTYDVDTFDLIMRGVWEFTVALADEDRVVFTFCAEG